MQTGTVSRLRFCRIQKSTSGGTLCFFGSHTFVPISWMCKKQTSVSHSSTELEIISLDAGLRLDGKPAHDLWHLIVADLHGNTYQSNVIGEEQLGWFKDSPQYRTLDTIDGEPMEFEWNIFSGFTTLQLVDEVQKFMNKISDPDQFQGRIIFMWVFNDIICGSEDNERECSANATLVSLFAKRFSAGRWFFLGPGSEKKWYSTYNERTRRMGQSR